MIPTLFTRKSIWILCLAYLLSNLLRLSRNLSSFTISASHNDDGQRTALVAQPPDKNVSNAQETRNVSTWTFWNESKLPVKEYPFLPPQPYPYAGALDQQQNWGYVHDPTVLQKRRGRFPVSATEQRQICAPPGKGPEGAGGYRLLAEKVRVSEAPSTTRVRIFCALYTYPGGVHRTNAIIDTWGRQCDGYMAASTFTEEATGTVHIPHYGTEGTYGSIWQKVRSMLSYIHDNFLQDYEYFHICGDDVYLIVDNLRSYLQRPEMNHSEPLFIGAPIMPFWRLDQAPNRSFYYNGGGPGYTLSREALIRFVQEALPSCHNETNESAEDFFMGICLWNLGIYPYNSQDHLGEFRYHHFDAEFLYRFDGKAGNGEKRFWMGQLDWIRRKFNSTRKLGLAAASTETVSFHRIKTPEFMKRMHLLLHGDNETIFCNSTDRNNTSVVVGSLQGSITSPQ